MTCKIISKKADRTCAGKRDKKVGFFDRKLRSTSESFTIDILPAFSAWCSSATKAGTERIDGTNTFRSVDTTIFYTDAGYFKQFEKKQLALLDDRYFEIKNIENINESNRTIAVVCVELGDLKDSSGNENETSWAKCE